MTRGRYLFGKGKVTDESVAKIKDMGGLVEAVLHTNRLAKNEMERAGGSRLANRMNSITAVVRTAPLDSQRFHPCLPSLPPQPCIPSLPQYPCLPSLPPCSLTHSSPGRPRAPQAGLDGGVELEDEEEVQKMRLEKEEAERKADNFEARMHNFYSIPSVKLMVRATMHTIMLLNYAQLLYTLETSKEVAAYGVPPISISECFFFFQAFANFADQAHQSMLLSNRKVTSHANFGALLSLGDQLLVVAFIVRVASIVFILPEITEKCYIFTQVLLSIDVVIISIRTINFRSVSMKFGVLVIMMEQMTSDLFLFIELFALVWVGFAGCFVGLTCWSDTPDISAAAAADDGRMLNVIDLYEGQAHARMLKNSGGSAVSDEPVEQNWLQAIDITFWAIFGEVDTDFFDAKVPYGQPVLFLYTVVASIVLVNLLVAMFADTYNKVFQNSEIEYKFQKYSRIFMYMNIATRVPPPFNVAIVGPELLLHYGTKVVRSVGFTHGMPDKPNDAEDPSISDSGHTSSSLYMDAYLQQKSKREAASQYGVAVAARDSATTIERGQTEVMDTLGDLQKEIAKIGDKVDAREAKDTAMAPVEAELSALKEQVALLTRALASQQAVSSPAVRIDTVEVVGALAAPRATRNVAMEL